MEVLLSSNAAVLERLLSSVMEAMVLEAAIAASKSLTLSLLMIGFLPNGSDIFPKESGTTRGFPLTELHPKNVPGPENQDGSDTEDDDDDEGVDDQDEGGDEDASGKEGDNVDGPEEEPKANGEGASDEEDEEDDDDDDDDDDEDDDDEEEEDEEEDEEEEEEEIPQPPAKKRK